MIKQTVMYKDLDGNIVSEDVYLRLNMAEVLDLELEADKSISEIFESIGDTPNAKEAYRMLKLLIKYAYGIRVVNDKGVATLKKSPELYAEFENSEPYSELILTIMSDENVAANFVNNVLPTEKIEEIIGKDPEARRKYEMEKQKINHNIRVNEQKNDISSVKEENAVESADTNFNINDIPQEELQRIVSMHMSEKNLSKETSI